MNTAKKLLALLLALVMLLCFAACEKDDDDDDDDDDGDKKPKTTTSATSDPTQPEANDDTAVTPPTNTVSNSVEGKWECKVDFTQTFDALIAEELGDESLLPNEKIYLNLSLTFEDGEFDFSIESVDCNDYADALAENLIEAGENEEDVEAFIEECFGDVEDGESMLSGCYSYDKANKIYVAQDEEALEDLDTYFVVTLKNGKLTVTDIVAVDEDGAQTSAEEYYAAMGMPFPWTFTK